MKRSTPMLENLDFGESILIEYPAVSPVHTLFYELIKWAESNSYPVLIDDFLDTLYLFTKQIELSGLPSTDLNKVKVIKLGGILDVGQVVGKVSVSETTILQKEYDRVFKQILEENVVNIVLGFDRYLSLLNEKKELLSALHDVLKYVGDKRRIAFYFINTDLMGNSTPIALPILEEGFTRVVRIEGDYKNPKIMILKALRD